MCAQGKLSHFVKFSREAQSELLTATLFRVTMQMPHTSLSIFTVDAVDSPSRLGHIAAPWDICWDYMPAPPDWTSRLEVISKLTLSF